MPFSTFARSLIEPHDVSFAEKKGNKFEKQTEKNITKPVFITCDSGIYYKITIEDDGNIHMINSDKPEEYLFRLKSVQ